MMNFERAVIAVFLILSGIFMALVSLGVLKGPPATLFSLWPLFLIYLGFEFLMEKDFKIIAFSILTFLLGLIIGFVIKFFLLPDPLISISQAFLQFF